MHDSLKRFIYDLPEELELDAPAVTILGPQQHTQLLNI